MTPQKQLFLHKPDEGIFGDCWRTCIACLLDLPPDKVPHFLVDGCTAGEYWSATRAWLNVRDLDMAQLVLTGTLAEILDMMKVMNPGLFYLLSGTSRTGCNHTVICKDGEIIHDPSLTDAGIIGPCDDGYHWINLITVKL